VTVSSVSHNQGTKTINWGSVDIEQLRALIAKHLDVDIRRVTDNADLSRDLGADWLDRLELTILREEISGVEIADHEADRIEFVGDLVHYFDGRQNVTRSALQGCGNNPTRTH
jgi:acyl carrier protein